MCQTDTGEVTLPKTRIPVEIRSPAITQPKKTPPHSFGSFQNPPVSNMLMPRCWPCFFGTSSRSTNSACTSVGSRKTTTAVSGICCGVSERIKHCPLKSVSDSTNEKCTRYTYLGGVRKTRRDLWTRAGRSAGEA
ncbi:hypothetical protein K0M31_017127 [Melipona bicolor]|uniref:Uncharacterized protein n=1 Tax=Melipona bicolor TaxID=60889 RepID=A0AA40FDI0_9HYME|nr:hypothetical protein K0M31_017127 [Melipona bicolor]